jgi:glycosyltransferase involved in cell wall biosynthesis
LAHALTEISTSQATDPALPAPGRTVQRVAVVLDTLQPGGKERVVATLARQLRQGGLAVTVIALHGENGLSTDLAAADVDVQLIRSAKRWDLGAIGRLAAVLRAVNPDVINVHDRFSLPYVVAARWLNRRVPIVLSCHGLLLSSKRPTWPQRLAARAIDAVTAVSVDAAQRYARFFGLTRGFELTPNGVDPVTVDPQARPRLRAELGVDDRTCVLLAVGAIKPEKGYQDLVAACRALRQQVDMPFLLAIAGNHADPAELERLEAAIIGAGLADCVRLLGHRDDVPDLCAAADTFVMPSRSEGLPLALLEAMSASLPVVATAVGGTPSVLGADAGRLVPPNDPQALAEALSEVMGDPARQAELGEKALAAVQRDYCPQAIAAAYMGIYRRVVSNERPSRKPFVVMLGPQPPLTGGMASVVDGLRTGPLAERVNLHVINNGKTTPPDRSRLRGLFAQCGLVWRLVRTIAQTRSRCVHIHTCSGLTFWRDVVHAFIARLLRARVILHVHGGRFADFAAEVGFVGRALMQRAFHKAAAVAVLGRLWRERLKAFAPRARFCVVPNGVHLPSAPAEPNDGANRFLFIGHLGHDKGAADLIEAAAQLTERGMDIHVDLAGGETADHQIDAMQARLAELGLTCRVSFLGLLTGPAKQRALAAAGALVLPSYVEAMPMVILEAMAHGRPVIATDVGSVPEIVTHGEEGFVVSPGDVDGLAGAMAQLTDDPALRERMGLAGRRRVEDQFGDAVVAGRIQVIYDALLRSAR